MANHTTLSLNDLAEQINNVINCNDTKKFQQFIIQPNIFNHEGIIKVLSDILAANVFTRKQKVIAASTFSLIYQSALCQNQLIDEKIEIYWEEYFTCMMDRNEDDLIDWRYLYQTINSLKLLISEKSIRQQSNRGFLIAKYNQTTFQGKLMLMYAVYENEGVSAQNQFLFIRQTIEDFISESLNVIMNVHDLEAVAPEMIDVERDIMGILYEWIVSLNNTKTIESLKEWDIVFSLSKNPSIISLIKEQFKCILQRDNGQIRYKRSDKLVELYDKDLINNTQERLVERMVENQLEIKSYAINMLEFLTHSYLTTSDLNDFDTFPVLNLAELLTPIFITELVENQLLKWNCINEEHTYSQQLKQLTISVFTLLRRTSQFNFLLQVYTQNQELIVYQVLNDYLRTSDDEIRAYKQDPSEFDSYNSNFITTMGDEFSDTVKEACGVFLKFFFQLNHQALVEYMDFLAATVRYRVLGETCEQIGIYKKKYNFIPESEMVYAVLTRIFYVNDVNNEDLFKFIHDKFLDHNIVFKLSGLDKTRVLVFLQYAYPKYYKDNHLDGLKFIQWTAESKQKSETQFKMVMQLLVVAFDHGIPEKIWDYVNFEIQRTQNYQIFKLVKQLIDKDLDSIETRCVLEAVRLICTRIKRQFTHCSPNYFLEHKGNEYSIFLKCFHILQQISEYQPLINKYDVILDEVMDLVDFFHQVQGLEKFDFSTEVVVLLNNILKVQQDVPIEFERYLPMLGNIVDMKKDFGPLVKTYYLILLKAGQTFQKNSHFLAKIKQSLEDRLLIPQTWTHEPLVIESLFLLSNILLVYPELCQENRQIFMFTEDVLEQEKLNTTFNNKLCASILIYWMAGEYAFENYDLGKLAESRIENFREEFGLMFAQCLKKLIEKYYRTESLDTLLKLAIKLLDNEIYYKKQKDYRGPTFTIQIFKDQLKMDAFQQIASALYFLKDKLDRNTYVRAIEMMKEEYGSEALSNLLSVRILDNKKERKIYCIKK